MKTQIQKVVTMNNQINKEKTSNMITKREANRVARIQKHIAKNGKLFASIQIDCEAKVKFLQGFYGTSVFETKYGKVYFNGNGTYDLNGNAIDIETAINILRPSIIHIEKH